MDRRRSKSASATGDSQKYTHSWNPIQKDHALYGGNPNDTEWPLYKKETEEEKNRKQKKIAWKSVEKIHDFIELKNQKVIDSALQKTKEVAHTLNSPSIQYTKKIKATGITQVRDDKHRDLYAIVDPSIDDPSFCAHFLQAVRHENAPAEVLLSKTLKPTKSFGEILAKSPRSKINSTGITFASTIRPMYVVSNDQGDEGIKQGDHILQEEHRNDLQEQKHKTRPHSASVIPTKNSDLSSLSTCKEAANTVENTCSPFTSWSSFSRISPSKKKDILSKHVERKWAEMMYRSPCFKQDNLKKLEQETYDLLEQVLIPVTGTIPRTSRTPSPRRMKGNDTNGNVFDEVACGTAVHLARQKQRKQIAHETSRRIQIERASQTIYKFLCLRFLIRKRDRMLKSIDTQATKEVLFGKIEQKCSESIEMNEDKAREELRISEFTERTIPAVPSLKTKVLPTCVSIETKRSGQNNPDLFAVDNLLSQAAITTRSSPKEIRLALKKQAAAVAKAKLEEKKKKINKKKKSTYKATGESWSTDKSVQPPKLDECLDQAMDTFSHQGEDRKSEKKQWSTSALDLMDKFMKQLEDKDKDQSESKVRAPSSSLLKPTQSSIHSVYMPYVPPTPKTASNRPKGASPTRKEHSPTAPVLLLEELEQSTSEAKELILHPCAPSIEQNLHLQQEEKDGKVEQREKPPQHPPTVNIIPSESMILQTLPDLAQPIDKNQVILHKRKIDIPDVSYTEIVCSPQPFHCKNVNIVTTDSVITKSHNEGTMQSESSFTVSSDCKKILAPLLKSPGDSAIMDINFASSLECRDGEELQIQVSDYSSVELLLLEEVEQILASPVGHIKTKTIDSKVLADANQMLRISKNNKNEVGSHENDDEGKDPEYEDDYEFEEEGDWLKSSCVSNLAFQNVSLDLNGTINAPANGMAKSISLPICQVSETCSTTIPSQEAVSLTLASPTSILTLQDTSLDMSNPSTINTRAKDTVDITSTCLESETKHLPSAVIEILVLQPVIDMEHVRPPCLDKEAKVGIASDVKDTDELGSKILDVPDKKSSSSLLINEHFHDEELLKSTKHLDEVGDLTCGDKEILPVEVEVVRLGSHVDENIQSITKKKGQFDVRDAYFDDQRGHKDLFINPQLELHKLLPVSSPPLNMKIVDTAHPDFDEENAYESNSSIPKELDMRPDAKAQVSGIVGDSTTVPVPEQTLQTVVGTTLQGPGATYKDDAATRIQRQFRLFISRQLLEENLKFVLRQNKRNIRKQAKQEAMQSKEVCTEKKEESSRLELDYRDVPGDGERIVTPSMDSKVEENGEIKSKNSSLQLSSSVMEISVKSIHIDSSISVLSISKEPSIPSSIHSNAPSILNKSESDLMCNVSSKAVDSISLSSDEGDYSLECSTDFSKQIPQKESIPVTSVSASIPRLSELHDFLADLDILSDNSKLSLEHTSLNQPVFTSTTEQHTHTRGGVESLQRHLNNPTDLSRSYAPQHSINDIIRSSSNTAVNNVETNWEFVKANSTLFQTLGNWSKYINDNSQTFYYNSQTKECVTAEPQEYTSQKSKLLGSNERESWSLRRSNSIRSQMLGEWQVFTDQETQMPFYYNSLTGESTWEKPHSLGQRNPTDGKDRENWDLRRKQSIKAHTYGEWQEFIDQQTMLPFYYNTRTGESMWEKPAKFLNSSAPMDRQVQQVHTTSESKWVMYIDQARSLPYYMNLETNETSWEKPIGFQDKSAPTAGAGTHPLSITAPQKDLGSDDDLNDNDDDNGEYAINIDSQLELDI